MNAASAIFGQITLSNSNSCPHPQAVDTANLAIVADFTTILWCGAGQPSFGTSYSGGFQFIHSTPCLIDGLVCVGIPARIGIGDGDAAAALAGDFIGRGSLGLRIEQGIRTVSVAMRPAIDRDRHNVARRLKSPRSQHAVKLVGNSRLVFRER